MKSISSKSKFLLCGSLAIALIFTGCKVKDKTINSAAGKAKNEYEYFINHLDEFPVSFTYDGKSCRGFDTSFRELGRETGQTGNCRHTKIRLSHAESGAQFTIDAKVYADYGAYEWTISITNTGDKNTGVFGDFNAADISFVGENPCLKGIHGDLYQFPIANLYSPYELPLGQEPVIQENHSGRPTHGNFPYFNLEYGTGGVLIAVGWPGCWRAEFQKEDDRTRFTGGFHEFRTCLKPGETVRTPLMAFVKYEGREEAAAMNLWRRWFIDCNMHKINGELLPPILASWCMSDGNTTDSILRVIKEYYQNGIPLDYYWMDAGWYTDASGGRVNWPKTGSLLVDTVRFPDKFADISAYLHQMGGKLLLWFEPEVIRLDKQEFLKYNPDFDESWMLGVAFPGTWLEGQLVDLGNAACRQWLLRKMTTVIDEGGIDFFRQDFNVDPAPVWRQNDTEGRQGFTENQYVQGYLALWDALIAKYPGMMIDACASGGGRNDLETMRRSVPLHYSDLWDGPDILIKEKQATMQSLPQWFPYFKCFPVDLDSLYYYRSNYAPFFGLRVKKKDSGTSWKIVRQAMDEWNQIKRYYYSDFYQLTDWNREDSAWRGWEYFDPKTGSGFGQLFRSSGSAPAEQTIKLFGLDKKTKYRIKDFDGRIDMTVSGSSLMSEGMWVEMKNAPDCTVFLIEAIR